MTLGTWRGQGRKREHETRYPEPRRETKLTLLGLAFEDALFHPEPAFLYASLSAASAFSEQANKPVTSLGFAHAGHSAWNALPLVPLHSKTRLFLWEPSRTAQQRVAFPLGAPQSLSTGALVLFYSFHHCVVRAGCLSFQLWLRREVSGQKWGGTGSGQRPLQVQVGGGHLDSGGRWRWGHGHREIWRDRLMA